MTDLRLKHWAVELVLAPKLDHWQRLDAVCSEETERLLVHCSAETHFRTCLSHWDIVKQPFQRSVGSTQEAAHRSSSCGSSLDRVDDQGLRWVAGSLLAFPDFFFRTSTMALSLIHI